MKRSLPHFLAVLIVLLHPVAGSAADSTEDRSRVSLSLEQAIVLAEESHPQLAEARARVDAAAGRADRAGTFPDPDLIVGAQQLPVEGGGASQEEYVAGIGQALPLGGRLGRARDAELLERDAGLVGLEVVRKTLRQRIHGAFATALFQERAHQTQAKIVEGTQRAAALMEARVEAGDAVPADRMRLEMEVTRLRAELNRIGVLKTNALRELELAIGRPGLRIGSLEGELDRTFDVPTLEALTARLADHPALRQADAEVRASEGWIDVAKAERIPDVRVEALYHRLEAGNQNTVDLGVSIALPLFNRNRGRLQEARAEAAAADARRRMTHLELSSRLREAHAEMTSALAARSLLVEELLPRAERLLNVMEVRFTEGDISLHELLAVRREVAELQLNHLESLREVMMAWAEVSGF